MASGKSWTDFSKADVLASAAMANGLQNLGKEIQRRSIILAPEDTGALRQSAETEISTKGDTVTVSFNTDYAKRRHFENNLHPSTKYYLSNGMKSIKDVKPYFKKEF